MEETMSAPLSSGKDRNATAPLAAKHDSNHAKALDILDELQRALDETRLAGAAQQSPPLQPSGEEDSPVEADTAPQWRSPYAPKSAQRTNSSAERVAVSRAKPSLIVAPGLANVTNPDSLGSVAARALVEKTEERHEPEELLAPEFMRAARPPFNRAQTARAASPQTQGAANGSGVGYAGPDDEEVLLRILQPKHPPVWDDRRDTSGRGTRRWVMPAGVLAATALAGGVGFFIYQFAGSGTPDTKPAVRLQQVAALAPAVHKTQDSLAPRAMTKLVLSDVRGSSNRPVALGVNIEAAPPGSFVVIRGLQSGSRVTTGSSVGEGIWRIPMRELPTAAVMPPHDFVGTMNLSVDLRRGDETIVDSDVQRITWTADAPTPAVATAVKTATIAPSADLFPPPPPPRTSAVAPRTVGLAAPSIDPHEQPQKPAPRRLDPTEVEHLIQRGDAALQSGDIAAARLLLRRAAESGDVTASMALAATYDPGVLTQLGARGAEPDVGTARAWYQKAADLGSSDAKRRLLELGQ
jgi:hypothetical protein